MTRKALRVALLVALIPVGSCGDSDGCNELADVCAKCTGDLKQICQGVLNGIRQDGDQPGASASDICRAGIGAFNQCR